MHSVPSALADSINMARLGGTLLLFELRGHAG